jgi:hypothetical protein
MNSNNENSQFDLSIGGQLGCFLDSSWHLLYLMPGWDISSNNSMANDTCQVAIEFMDLIYKWRSCALSWMYRCIEIYAAAPSRPNRSVQASNWRTTEGRWHLFTPDQQYCHEIL